jgi:hypothetical protein
MFISNPPDNDALDASGACKIDALDVDRPAAHRNDDQMLLKSIIDVDIRNPIPHNAWLTGDIAQLVRAQHS